MTTVVLTRPHGKNTELADALRTQGVQTLTLPALTLAPTMTTLADVYQPAGFDLLIFVSAQAARFYLHALNETGLTLPIGQKIATVGAASAQPFYEDGLAAKLSLELIHPLASHPYQDSEALWQQLQFRLDEFERVLLIRGQQGREWLSEQLLKENKVLNRCCIYERLPAMWQGCVIDQLRSALKTPASVIFLLTSSESTQAIYTNIKRLNLTSLWQQAHFVAIHPRIAQTLQQITSLTSAQATSHLTLCAPSQPAMLEALLSAAMPNHA